MERLQKAIYTPLLWLNAVMTHLKILLVTDLGLIYLTSALVEYFLFFPSILTFSGLSSVF